MRSGSRLLYLVGFMGCGKTVVGRELAGALGWSFVDTDRRVEEREGVAIVEIFRRHGEARFRGLERSVLEEISVVPRQVVATGGGLFLGRVQRQLMRATGTTVWLDAPLNEIRERLRAGGGRPLWLSDEPILMRALFEKRKAVYALADIRMSTSGQEPAVISEAIRSRLARDPSRVW